MRFNKFSRKKLPILAIAAMLFVVSGAAGFVWHKSHRSTAEAPLTASQLFAKELRAIKNDITELDAYLENHPPAITDDLRQYLDGMQNLKLPCRQIETYEERYKLSDASEKLKDGMSQARQLCVDYIQVLEYSRALHFALYPYLTIDTSLDTNSKQDISERLITLENTIGDAKNAVSQVNSKQVEDPGRSEIVMQIELAEKAVAEAKAHHTNGADAGAQAALPQAMDLIRQDKTDFLHARRYFWKNTVRIKALQNTLDRQIALFEAVPY